MPDFTTYQSPFSWRYGSDADARAVVRARQAAALAAHLGGLAEAEAEYSLVSPAQTPTCAPTWTRSTWSVHWRSKPTSSTT